MWEMTGHGQSLAVAAWPGFDPDVARPDEVVVPVQVNGKVRARLTVPSDTPEDGLRDLALTTNG